MNYLYDQNNVRYTLTSTHGTTPYNWLFFPGGPGADSSYFLPLTELLQLSGNTWLIDFPGNGSHTGGEDNNFDHWLALFLETIQRFQNPIIIGHSFGGMLPLLFKELESLLSGLIIIDSAPGLWLEAAVTFAAQHQLPDLSHEMHEFTVNPNQHTFDIALQACTPYYFPPQNLQQGRSMLANLPFTYHPAVWWQRKAVEMPYQAHWIPQTVKTLIIGGEYDAITPFSLFDNDPRFSRPNIQKALLKNAGHFPWLDQPEQVKTLIKNFENTLRVR
jgi:pimeloyl-ACP methyl ester carboxylesterase